ncbi:YkvA family protein [Telluribacter humicola]|uniref:YkvA family protein n=1 Tax=Telluribacter humicola TaxID=1720261 RepID=UPI001A95752A|nr:DUF1232 domain-containing protein [Telluribacter humicola]
MANSSLITRVLRSIFFSKALGKAGRLSKNKAALLLLVQQVLQKSNQKGMRNGLTDVIDQLQLLVRMVRSYASGEYRGIATSSFVKVVASLIYFVSPIDLIPDFLPIIGIADDLALLGWLFKTLGGEIQKFSAWEKQKQVINIG